MKHLLHTLCLILILLSSCTKNEFSVQVQQAASMPPVDLKLVFYAFDAKRGWLLQRDIPASFAQPIICQTSKPTLVYVLSPSKLLTVFWAERGDKMLLHYRDGFWIASGNAVTDSLARWQAKNRNIIQARATTELNAKVADFIRSHRSDIVSAILLHTYFSQAANPDLYASLLKSLNDDAASPDVLRALGSLPLPSANAAQTVPALHLLAYGDSLPAIRPADAPATVYIFWNNPAKREAKVNTLVRLLRKNPDIRIVDINMQADTLNWRQTFAHDSVMLKYHLWAPGAEQNSALIPLALSGPDFIIVADRKGKQAYRGDNPAEAAKMALKLL